MRHVTIEQVIASPSLPSPLAVALEIIELVQRPDVRLPDLAAAIGRDAALASKILRTANSSYYARARSVSKLSDALMILGLRRVKTLALGFSLVDDIRRGTRSGFDHSAFWQRSLLAGVAARAIAEASATADQEEAFLAGLTHALGVVALSQALGDEYHELVAQAGGSYPRLIEIEDSSLGLNHTELGGALAERWNLPPQLVAALRYHRTPTNAPASYAELVRCVAIGALAADVFAAGTLGEGLAAYRTACERWFRLPTEDADGLLVRIGNEAGPLRALLDLPETGVRAGEILARANEALEMLSFMAEDEHNKLEEERERLTAQASTDALTGLGNRRHFDAFFGRAFHQAVRDDAPLSLLMLDLDRFKGINDRYGHPAGDLVLRAAAGAIRESVRATDLAARYGGEEFAIVMPGTGAAGAFGLARRLRASIERLELDLGEEHGVHVTASLGVASLDRARHQRPDDLIADADGALYEAKESGRNMVRLSRGRECAAA